MLVGGWGTKNTPLGFTRAEKCSRCGNFGPWIVYESKKRITLYWIPVAQWNKRFVVECSICPNAYEVDRSTAEQMIAEGAESGHQQFLLVAAAILKTAAKVEGPGSEEWLHARQLLVFLADQTISESQAEELLQQASESDIDASPFDDEERLVLLNVAVNVAAADGSVSPREITALETLAARFGISREVVHVLIGMALGDSPDGVSSSEVENARRVLGVEPDASVGEIRAAYKRLMLQHHPDRATPENREEATRKSAEINAAYDLLIGRANGSKGSADGPSGAREQRNPSPKPPPPRSEPPKPKRPAVCGACERRLSEAAKFCGFCGTKAGT